MEVVDGNYVENANKYIESGASKLRQLTNWSSTPLRDGMSVSLGVALLTVTTRHSKTIELVAVKCLDAQGVKHVHTVVKAAHVVTTMEKEMYTAALERLLGDAATLPATAAHVTKILEYVATLQVHFIGSIKNTMKAASKKVLAVPRPLA